MSQLYNCVLPDGSYQNPVLVMDYSDPDVIRVGGDYYMVASSFTYLPGVPVLHSRDLIHWRQIAWCVQRLPFARYARPAHGCGTWAPAIRCHDGLYYVFIPLPDEGIFVTTAKDPAGPWSELHCLYEGAGWIDPCPFWDDDGQAYMAHAYANSRCGIKHRIDVCRMAPDASRLLDEGTLIYQNELLHATMEGPKMYKRNGWYYIFAPAGGVATGWQVALRAQNPLGPYEPRIVLHQGNTDINGPHQGAWVDTPDGRDWFFHFQDAGVYGRILHLQPMCWVDGWPFIGQEQNGDNIGEPVAGWRLPLPECAEGFRLDADDEFRGGALGIQWQWQANPNPAWYRLDGGLRLNICPPEGREPLLWYMPNVLTQLPQAWAFTMETSLTLEDGALHDEAGIAVMGHHYSALALCRAGQAYYELRLYQGEVTECTAEGVAQEAVCAAAPWQADTVRLRLHFIRGGQVEYSYFDDGAWRKLGGSLPADKSAWSGAKPALFARNTDGTASGGAGVFRYVHFEKGDAE